MESDRVYTASQIFEMPRDELHPSQLSHGIDIHALPPLGNIAKMPRALLTAI